MMEPDGSFKDKISFELEKNATAERECRHVGMLSVKTANRSVEDALKMPDPVDLYHGLLNEGEVACLFADSNAGKSIFAVQMGDYISRYRKVLYVDCELSEKQFQLRYTNKEMGYRHVFSDNFYRAEIDPMHIGIQNYEEAIIKDIEEAALQTDARIVIIDNLTYLCNSSEKGDVAGLFMMKLIALKKKHTLTLLIISHTPKRNLSNPITQNDLAGSKKLYNFFDNVFAIGQSAQDKRIKFVKQVKVRAGEYLYDSDNVIVYEITNDGGYVHFLHKGYGKEAEHLRDKTEEDDALTRSNIQSLHREGKSVREIADLVSLSKTTVHRIITREKEKETVSLGDAVPSRDAGQAGHVGQDGTLADAAGQCVPQPDEPDPGGSFVFDLYDNFEF
jgi:predicted ATP-dependent serine protease